MDIRENKHAFWIHILVTMTDLFLSPQEHGSDLNEAVNAYFNEGDRSTYVFHSLEFYICVVVFSLIHLT